MSITQTHPLIHFGADDHDEEEAPPTIGATDAFVRITSKSDRGSSDRFVGRFLALMIAGVTEELVAEVVTVGLRVKNLAPGDRVVVPATVRCSRVSNVARGHARVLRVPSADRTLMKVPSELRDETDERVLLLYRRRLEWLDAAE